MAVNEINLAVGQKWLTRGGEEVEIVNNDGHEVYPWDLSSGFCVTNQGQVWEFQESSDDLITLIQDEHGFIPWNGGECPVGDYIRVEYKMRGYDDSDITSACSLYWEHKDTAEDIIAYRVVKQEVKPTKVDAEGEQKKEIVMEAKTEVTEEPKYTVEQVFEAINAATDEYAPREIAAVKEYLAKTQDPDYKLYLELKAKFE